MIDRPYTNVQQERLAALAENDYRYTTPLRGAVHQGVILSISESEVVVQLTETKRDEIVPSEHLESLNNAYRARASLHLEGIRS